MSELRKVLKEDWKAILLLLIIVVILAIITFEFPEFKDIIEIAVAILFLIALILAIKQYLDAKSHTDTLGDHADALDTISQSLSTRYLSEFPRFLPDITKLVERADEKLTIFCDVPTYGKLSAPEHFFKLKQVVETKLYENRHFQIQFIHLNKGELIKVFNEQIPPLEWENWRGEHKEQLRTFLEDAPPIDGQSPENLDYEVLRDLWSKHNEDMLKNTAMFRHSRVIRAESYLSMPVCFWVRDDDQEAIFSFTSSTGTVPAFGFYTVDGRLIQALKSTFERYQGAIKRHQDEKQQVLADAHEIGVFKTPLEQDFEQIYLLDQSAFSQEELIPKEIFLQWFRANKNTFTVLYVGERIVGYYSILPLKERTLEKFVNGEISEMGFTSEDILPEQEVQNARELYFFSMVVDKKYEPRGFQLVQRLVDELKTKKAYPQVQTVYAAAATATGRKILQKLGFVQIGDAAEREDGHDLYEYSYDTQPLT